MSCRRGGVLKKILSLSHAARLRPPLRMRIHILSGQTAGVGSRAVVSCRCHYTYSGPGSASTSQQQNLQELWKRRDFAERAFTVGIGGPVGSGKTAVVHRLCQVFSAMQQPVAVVTNDIFTAEDAEFLIRQNALPADKIRAVETGGCPHAAIREDISANLTALEELTRLHFSSSESETKTTTKTTTKTPLLLLCESGGDNLAANFSRELADLTLYVIDVAAGDKVPRKGGPGITQSDLLIINKVDLADAVGADLSVMELDAKQMRKLVWQQQQQPIRPPSLALSHSHDHHHRHHHPHHHSHHPSQHSDNDEEQTDDDDSQSQSHAPFVFAAIKHQKGLSEIVDFILTNFQKAMQISSSSSSSDSRKNAVQ